MFTQRMNDLMAQFDAESLMETVTAIHATDRWFTFSSFARTAEWAAEEMRRAGLCNVEVVAFPADGKTAFGDWVMPLAWDAEEVTATIVEPARQSPVLADRRNDPCSSAMWCAPTPPEGITAEVVNWDALSPESRKTVDLHGRFVYSEASPAQLKGQVAACGAAGLISGYHGGPTAGPEGVFWQNNWSDHGGWAMTAADRRLPGFMLAPDKAALLREALNGGGPVRVHAAARTRLYEGNVLLVTGVLPGQTTEEVTVLGHLFEQGASDNASGAAAILHAARALSGCLPRPRRSVRFMLTSECYSTLPFAVTRREVVARTLAAINVDMLSPWDNEPAVVEVLHNPDANVSFADPLLEWIVRRAFAAESLPLELQTKPYEVADNLLTDPFIGIPTPMLSCVSRTYWHNSADTPSRLRPEVLRVLAAAATTWLAFLADAGGAEARWLADLLADEGTARIENAPAERKAYVAGREAARIRSTAALCRDDVRQQERIEASASALERSTSARKPAPVAGPPEERLIPVRNCPAPLTLHSVPLSERDSFPSPLWSAQLNCALFWADGRRSIADIRRLVELERGGAPPSLTEWFHLLARYGYVELRSQG